MYKVKKKGKGSFTSKGVVFYGDAWKEVSKEVFDYLKKYFKDIFDFESTTRKQVNKDEVVEKTVRKRTTKAK